MSNIDDLDQANQVRVLVFEAACELDVPVALRAAMFAIVRDSYAELAASLGTERAVATIAETAFLAGRKAERAGLMFRKFEV